MRLHAVLLWPVVGVVLWTIYCSICLARNYIAARKTGLPIRVIPIDHTNGPWTLLDRKILSLVKKLPGFLGNNSFTRYNFRTWELHDRYKTHHELGPVYMIVTPGRNWVYIADPDLIMEMFRRRTDFPQCIELTEMLDVFGKNLGTVEGKQWQSQRKLIATCFNEQNYQIVWTETLSLAADMLQYWTKKESITSSAEDLRTLSLHILTGAGFDKHFPFEGHDVRDRTSVSGSYKNALQMILENCILIMGIGPKALQTASLVLPASWKLSVLARTCADFQRYMTELYEEEKAKQAKPLLPLPPSSGGDGGRANTPPTTLMSSLVRASLAAGTGGLSESEIYGNIFMLNFTGHDTTAHTLTFALHLLAAHPDVQSWLCDEIRAVFPPSSSSSNENENSWDYTTAFPRLTRCLAVMLETLRLYTPIPIAKWTAANSATTLKIGGKVHVLPANTMVIPAGAAVHTDPGIWGDDSLVWRPARWIKPHHPSPASGGSPGKAPDAGAEEILAAPQDGAFLGWSEGARNCPARKFSQVEFVATMATLFRDWRVDVVAVDGDAGDSAARARRRVVEVIENDSGAVLLLQMLHPERVSLRWSRRLD